MKDTERRLDGHHKLILLTWYKEYLKNIYNIIMLHWHFYIAYMGRCKCKITILSLVVFCHGKWFFFSSVWANESMSTTQPAFSTSNQGQSTAHSYSTGLTNAENHMSWQPTKWLKNAVLSLGHPVESLYMLVLFLKKIQWNPHLMLLKLRFSFIWDSFSMIPSQ
jgi:hypothetical protein